jgi:uncharacterized protein YjiS (DUF1127 family)
MQRPDRITKQDDWRIAMTPRSLGAPRTHAFARFRVLHHLWRLSDIARTRRALRKLDDHLLRDLGLTRHEAEAEATRALWDAPLHWRG